MSERETMEYDVVVVGAGPSGLAFAIRLKQLDPDARVCLIEKASTVGAQILSGAVIEPGPLDALLPGWRDHPPPICVAAAHDEFLWLRDARTATRLPTPPQMHNTGNFIVSLGAMCAWLAPQAEALGVDVFPGFAAADPVFDDSGAVAGVRIGDMGVARDGSHKPAYTQGIDILAKLTVLAEGCRGSVAKKLIAKYGLDRDCDPQTYGIGLKELWQLPEGRVRTGQITHTLGWPLDNRTYGGSFIYQLDKDRIAIGFIAGLDYSDPLFRPWEAFQQLKNHERIAALLDGGQVISAGARALVEGGLQSLPRVEMPGALLVGDAAGLLNVPKIKGTHQAIRSGMLAAEHFAEKRSSAGFDARLRASRVAGELKKVRNIRPGFRKGLWGGLLNAAWETATAGLSPWTLKNHADWSALDRLDPPPTKANRPGPNATSPREPGWIERTLPPRDRLAGVYFAATEHDEDQPVHLRVADTSICVDRCVVEYANPCTRFCPANVYEMVEETGSDGGTSLRLQVNSANCVHCKTCDIKDPYEIITWTTPEGGSGPNYQSL